MESDSFYFGKYRLDPSDRRLVLGKSAVALNARYLDALILLVREQGKLISKQRFLDEVWEGTPVTDEALTQCIRTLRKQLGDNAANPRFIETAPKHGYRFIAPVELAAGPAAAPPGDAIHTNGDTRPSQRWGQFLRFGAAGAAGGGAAGLIGGLFYGFAAASEPLASGAGGISVLLVIACLTIAVALIGGAGVAFGIAAAEIADRRRWFWRLVGGAAGGLVVGAIVKLISLDAFNLLFGHSPGDITGAAEGALLGGGIGMGAALAWLGANRPSLRRSIALAMICGGSAGILVSLTGGRLMGGSLDLLSRHFPDSRLRLDSIGALFGESGFGPISQAVTCALEGALFGACIIGAICLARGHRPSSR